jgi:outer membrane protein assembly factor BamB
VQDEEKLTPRRSQSLAVKWEATVVGSTSATPTVQGGFVYVPDWEGACAWLFVWDGGDVWDSRACVRDWARDARRPVAIAACCWNLGRFLTASCCPRQSSLHSGHLYCLNAETGAVVWSKEIRDYFAQLQVTLTGEQQCR